MRSPFFWRLYLALSLLVLLTAAIIGGLATRQIERDFSEQIFVRLRTETAALMPLAYRAFAEGDDVQALVRDVGRDSGSRITLVAPDGLVLADSDEDPAAMDNHAGRPELVAAFRDGIGTSRRYSNTVRRELLYVARRLTRDGVPLGAVRVALPLSEIDGQLAALRTQVLAGAGFAMLAALAIGAFVASRISSPIAEMTAVSEALRRGDYRVRVRGAGVGEIRTLGSNLNRMADELSERIDSLAAQRAQLDTIIRSMQEGVLAVDGDDRVVVSNAAGRSLLGLGDGDPLVLGRDELSGEDGIRQLLDAVRAEGVAAQAELTLTTADGEIVLDARAAPFSADRPGGVVLVLYNISELRRLERVRTDFVANVSHELKTPLTSIQGYVETLLDGAVHDTRNNMRFLEKIQSHVHRLSALVADLLSLARIESQPLAVQTEVIDWREVVADSVAQRRDPIAHHQLRLTLELGDQALQVLGDREAMRQVVDNLIDNAIAYTPDGGSVRVSLTATAMSGCLVVADTGIGIPDDDLDRIFERFYRVDRGRSRAIGGTGLGLSIVRNLVQRMGGSITVKSAIGKGSMFTVALPRPGTRTSSS